jgi:predicted nucleic acid-binding protein
VASATTSSVLLADTSAWTNRDRSEAIRRDFDARLAERQIATCDPVVFELLWLERDVTAVQGLRDELEGLRCAPVGERVWRRVFDVFEQLAALGPLHHRQVGLPDLLVAAAAERAEMPVLHYDRHFELIASVTGQEIRALAPLGSLP